MPDVIWPILAPFFDKTGKGFAHGGQGTLSNRMPLILLLFTFSLIFIVENYLRKFFIPFIIISIISFLSVYNFNQSYKKHINRYYDRVTEFVIFFSDIYSKDKETKKRGIKMWEELKMTSTGQTTQKEGITVVERQKEEKEKIKE